MSISQHQRTVNRLEEEIAKLEERKAKADKKSADELKKAYQITISKNASPSSVRIKTSQIERHKKASSDAATLSAQYASSIANKKKKLIKAKDQLQKSEAKLREREQKSVADMRQAYEMEIVALKRERMQNVMRNHAITEAEYDVFVSHAWEDKESFVNEFVDALMKRELKVWWDKQNMVWGDSMRERMDEGLKHSRLGIVILSPDYIADGKYWTKAELNALFQLESMHGKTILPIWHNLSKKEVVEFSPLIADKLALTTAEFTPDEMAEKFYGLFSKQETELDDDK